MTSTADSAPSVKPAAATVLIVDDVPANLFALEAVLEPLGVGVERASSGEEALRQLLRTDFALVLLDVQMPGLDGFQTAALMKQLQRTRSIPIIFLTAISRDTEHIFKGYQHGAVDYLLKPYDPHMLRTKVSVFVDLFAQSVELKRQSAELLEQTRITERERRARAEAESASKARVDVLAMVSHDLRQPLATISVAASGLGGIPKQAVIERSVAKMDRLINDLLDIARIESGRLSIDGQLQPVKSLLQEVVDLIQPLATVKEQKLEVQDGTEGASVWCDRERFSQIVSNLLGNAMKFTPPGGTLTLRAQTTGDGVQFSVADTGPGIPADRLAHLFDGFWQPKSTGRREGLGIGLAISRRIVEAHGGKLWVESSSSGATFTFSLLRAHPNWSAPEPSEDPQPGPGRH